MVTDCYKDVKFLSTDFYWYRIFYPAQDKTRVHFHFSLDNNLRRSKMDYARICEMLNPRKQNPIKKNGGPGVGRSSQTRRKAISRLRPDCQIGMINGR